MYEEDTKLLISQAFERLVIGEDSLNLQLLLAGLGVGKATHVDPLF